MVAIANKGRNVRFYPLETGQTFSEGAVVFLNSGNGRLVEAGADPAVILGFSLHAAGAGPHPGDALVILAISESTFWLEGSRAPVSTDRGKNFGLSKRGDGVWIVDATKTGGDARVSVEEIDTARGLFEVKILPANRQLG